MSDEVDPDHDPLRPVGPPRQYFIGGAVPPSPSPQPSPSPRPMPAREPQARGPQARQPPTPQRQEPVREKRRSRRRVRPARSVRRALTPKLRWLWLYLPLLLILLGVGAVLWAWTTVEGLDRVDLGTALTPASGDAVNYLIVGSDSREGITAETPNAGAIGPGVTGKRSDTIIVLRVEPTGAKMMSIPRDLWLTNAATGKQGRINAAYNAGPANLVRTVTSTLGISIQHYVEIDFVSFSAMVDAMGGITIDFPHPAKDGASGLDVTGTGPQLLDGPTSLAYVRSRHYTELIDGKLVTDPTSDLGRQQRQQNFIRAVLTEVGSTRNPITAVRLVNAAAGGVRVDGELGVGDVWSLARQMSEAQPTSVVLPTTPARKGSADVLLLSTAKAAPILHDFGAK